MNRNFIIDEAENGTAEKKIRERLIVEFMKREVQYVGMLKILKQV